MKKWEEERRKKQYNEKIHNTKPVINSQVPKAGKSQTKTGTTTQYGSSKGFNVTNTSVSSKVTRTNSGLVLASSEERQSHYGEAQLKDLPIFQLLKAFKLQQYAKKLDQLGYGDDLYKLALLNERQREDLIGQLKVLPGHKAKLTGLFSVIDEIYPKKIVAEQLKQFTPAQPSDKKGKVPGSIRGKNIPMQTTKSLLQQYQALDPITKQAFNETFLANLETAKYNMGQLISKHVNKEESKQAINMIFPPQFYGIGQQEIKGDENYNKEIESLLQKYSQKGGYSEFNNQEALLGCVGHGQAQNLKKEMSQAIQDLQKINQERSKKQLETDRGMEESIKEAISVKDLPPMISDRPMSVSSKYEVFTDDQEKSQVSYQLPDDSYTDITESQLIKDAISILNDTKNFQQTLKEQYELVAKQEQKKKEADISLLNPLAQGDDSKLNNTQINQAYEKQQVYKDEEEAKFQRPLSPLLDKNEREKVWNLGQSLNSKQVTSALGYLDLKQICYCLAHAVMKHIEFSEGFYFIDDLQEKKRLEMTHVPQGKELEFTYNLDQDLKIDIEKAKEKKKQKEQQNRKEFEELKMKMVSSTATPVIGLGAEKKLSDKIQVLEEVKVSGEVDEQIEDEAPEEEDMEDESQIQDYYEDMQMTKGKKGQEATEDDDHIDFDYSQTHLEDFLKSQTANNLLKGSNVQSSQLLNTFLTSYNKMRTGTLRSMQQTNPMQMGKVVDNMQPISENYEKEESETESKYKTKSSVPSKPANLDEDDEEDLGRSVENINLQDVEVVSRGKRTPSKPILSKEDIERAKNIDAQPKELKIDVQTKKGFKELLRFQMRVFDQNYDFNRDELIGGESMYLGNPSLEELYYYYKYVIISGRMEKEIPILCLIYLERFLTKTGVLINHANWKRLSLICLLLASKIWDDDSLENVHFPQVMPDITLKEITALEKVMLSLLDYDLVIRGAEYAKYYFILKTFSEKFNSTLPMGPLTAEQMSDLQNNTLKAESNLREKYNVKMSLKKTM